MARKKKETNQPAPEQHSGEIFLTPLEEVLPGSMLPYAEYVILDRALPRVEDGLKPVQRRILYTMYDMGLTPDKPHKKSARIVGECMGKYHPHGDSSVYDAMVRMAQDFNMRMTLVNGHGNFGSVDGDPAAAMRYTEARLEPLALELLRDIEKETVRFTLNFDDSLKEPETLPGRFPNLLVNGASGIAVGLATNIPPHNLGEVIDGICAYIDNPKIKLFQMMKYIQAPDFPTGGYIIAGELLQAYETGRGKITLRAKVSIEEGDNDKKLIVITELPYQVNKAKLLTKIASLRDEKKEILGGISEITDESDRNGMRAVIKVKKDADAEKILAALYKYSDLETTFGINMVALVDGQPRLLNLRQIIEAYLRHRREVVTRRTIFRLNKNRMRGHILEGQAVALSNLDEFLAIIRNSPNPPIAKQQLMARGWRSELVSGLLTAAGNADDFRPQEIEANFGLDKNGEYHLSPIQAERILQMALQKLTGLEQDKINNEYRECNAEIVDLLDILAKPERVVAIMDAELEELKVKYGDERRSEIDYAGDPNFNPLDFIPNEKVVVTLSQQGYIKRLSLNEYRSQRRGGQGKRAAKMKEGDVIEQLFVANSHDTVLCFTNLGKCLTLPVYSIPEGARTSKGKAIVNLIALQEGERVQIVLPVSEFADNQYVFMATEEGYVKKTPLSQFAGVNRKGKRAIVLEDNDSLIGAAITDGEHDVMLFSDAGKATRFAESDVRSMGCNARGVLGMKLDGAKIISLTVADDEDKLVLTVCENGYGKCTPVSEYSRHGRNTKGMIAIQMSERNGRMVSATLVSPNDTVMLLTSQGNLVRTPVNTIRVAGRVTQGVTLMDVLDDRLVSVTRVAEDDADEQTEEALEEVQSSASSQEPQEAS